MKISQVFLQYNYGGTERIIDFLSKILNSKNNECYSVFKYEGFQPSYLNTIIDPSYKSVKDSDLIIVHGGLLSSQDYLEPNIFNNISVIEILHRLHKVKYIPQINYVAVSEKVKDIQDFECKVIHNPILIDDPKTNKIMQKQKLNIEQNSFVIGRHCRFACEKNWGDFIYVCNYILKYCDNVSILITGNKNNNEVCSNLLEKWTKSNNRIILADWTNNPQEILQCCDLYLETSKNEAFSIATCEAAKLKIPVISYVGILNDVLKYYFVAKDRDEICYLILKIIEGSINRIFHVEKAHSYVCNNYSFKKIKSDYINYINQTVQKN